MSGRRGATGDLPNRVCKRKLSPQKLPLFRLKPRDWSVDRIPAVRLTKLPVPLTSFEELGGLLAPRPQCPLDPASRLRAKAHEWGKAGVLRGSVGSSSLGHCPWRGHEMVKAQQRRAFPDRLCLILPPALTDPRPQPFFHFPRPPPPRYYQPNSLMAPPATATKLIYFQT